jgi:tripartite-type tricarboxylate transporter receptor subunit TctC
MIRRLAGLLIVLIGISPIALAQDYPTRSITVVLPFPPGGPLDFLLRSIQGRMESALGQPIIIESKPGAAGNVGTAAVAKAEPDGYTLLGLATNFGIAPYVFSHLPFDPVKDFAVVGSLAETPGVCIVNPASKYHSLAELIKDVQANPGKISYGSGGAGTPSHLEAEMIAKVNNLKWTHVPYKGGVPQIADILGNFIDFGCTGLAGWAFPLIQDGKLRPLAVTSAKRSRVLPDVPTVKELGFGDLDDSSRYIILAPAMTPKPIIERLSKTLVDILADPSLRELYLKSGYEVSDTNPEQVAELIKQQAVIWGPMVKELNLKFD